MTSTRSSKKGLATGLTAGLLGGAAAGMVFGVPGLSSAATSTEPAAIVQQVDDPIAPDAEPTDDRPGRGTLFREMLQPLVDDGTITAVQADAVTAHVAENAPDRPGRGHHRRAHFDGAVSEAVLELLDMDAETLRAELQDGQSLADVATANGVDPQAVIDAIVAEIQAKIDEAVANGDVDAERAAERSANLEERVTARVNGERPERPNLDAEG